MEHSEKQAQGNKKVTNVSTFTVPFNLEETKEDFNISTNTPYKPSKEQIFNQAFKFHSQGNISEAAKYYQYFIAQGFKDPIVFTNYGVILKDIGNLKKAELSQRKAIEIKPDFVDAHSNLGIILKDLGKLKEAELSLRKAIELNPGCAEAHYNLGNILNDLGKLKDAELSYLKAIKLNPNFAKAHSNLGIILREIGNLKEAELSLRKAIELKPDFAEAHSNLGNILNDLGKLKEAESSLNKAIELKPKFTTAILNRWQLFFDQGKFDLALKDADSCDTKNSRAGALETLYALGRIDEIYERIEKNSKLDEGNIRISALSSFLTVQEKKKTANNFCRNPLSFLYFSNIKSHLKDCNKFIKEIISELLDLETIWEPPKNTTHNGFHTPTHINLLSNSSKNISQLKSIILNELDSYFLKYEKESCSYIQKWPSNKKLHAWNVILKKQGYQSAHIHPNGWLSGVIYLKVVPSLGKDEGAIEFSLNGPNYSNINSPQLIHQPKVGDIVLFPSSLYHRTIPFSSDTDRIVFAFDLMPN